MIRPFSALTRIGSGGARLARLSAVPILLAAATPGQAVRPASPQLDQASRLALVRALSAAGISETGSSAVLNSLLSVLGTRPASRRYRYREPYPQLPDVDAAARPVQDGCARVDLTARSKAEPRRPVAIRGVYCLADQARYVWAARSLSIGTR